MTSPIVSLATRLSLSTEGFLARRIALSRHADVALSLWPKAAVNSVGSFPQGTSLRDSDLDVVVHIPNKVYRRHDAGQWALELRRVLVKQEITTMDDSNVLLNARIPILTYLDVKEKVDVDVSFIPNSVANTEYVRQELEIRPYMQKMLILLKYWLKSRNMNKTWTGGLGSYALSLSVIGYFNVRKHTKARKVTPETYNQWLADQDIYYLLIDYLTFWASQWKYAKHMLEPHEGGIYKKGSKGHCGGRRNSRMSIADPTDPKNDVGEKATNITQIRTAMKLLKDRLIYEGPNISDSRLLDLLENTGRPFRAAKGSSNYKLKPPEK